MLPETQLFLALVYFNDLKVSLAEPVARPSIVALHTCIWVRSKNDADLGFWGFSAFQQPQNKNTYTSVVLVSFA